MVSNQVSVCAPGKKISETNKKANVMVVDDEEMIRDLLTWSLQISGYGVVTAPNAAEASAAMALSDFELALIDIQMPGEDGIALLGRIVEQYPDTAVIMASGLNEIETAITTLKMGAYDYVTKPFDSHVVESRLERALEKRALIIENRNYHVNLEHLVEERTHELKQALSETTRTYAATIKTLGAALNLRDSKTEDHCNRVAAYVLKLARAYGVKDKDQLRDIEWGAYLHDIGKIGVPDAVLLKPGKLTPAERSLIETHSELGYQLLKEIQFLDGAAELVLTHHESYDGTGYPRGLKGSHIPLSARLFAVADTVDAMTSDRPYRKALSIEVAGEELKRLSGVQYDPRVVDVFFSLPKEEWSV